MKKAGYFLHPEYPKEKVEKNILNIRTLQFVL